MGMLPAALVTLTMRELCCAAHAAITFDVRDSDGTEKATVSEVHLGTLAADTIGAAAGVSVYAAAAPVPIRWPAILALIIWKVAVTIPS